MTQPDRSYVWLLKALDVCKPCYSLLKGTKILRVVQEVVGNDEGEEQETQT